MYEYQTYQYEAAERQKKARRQQEAQHLNDNTSARDTRSRPNQKHQAEGENDV